MKEKNKKSCYWYKLILDVFTKLLKITFEHNIFTVDECIILKPHGTVLTTLQNYSTCQL